MQQTEDEWFDETIKTYQSKLIAYASRILGDSERSKDTVQDAFVRLYQMDSSKVRDHVAPWLYRVVRNLALNTIRKDKRMTQFPATEPESESTDTQQQRETTESLFEMVHDLPPPKDELIMLKFKDGFSYKEIASITGLSVSNVGYQLHHAIRELKAQWEAQTATN